jgi:hypothetical protein
MRRSDFSSMRITPITEFCGCVATEGLSSLALGISNRRFQRPSLRSEICHLRFVALARTGLDPRSVLGAKKGRWSKWKGRSKDAAGGC